MTITRQAAEAKLTAMRARHYKTAAGGSRMVFYVPATKQFVAVDGRADGRVDFTFHASCPACK